MGVAAEVIVPDDVPFSETVETLPKVLIVPPAYEDPEYCFVRIVPVYCCKTPVSPTLMI
jgi:hypothetical protein